MYCHSNMVIFLKFLQVYLSLYTTIGSMTDQVTNGTFIIGDSLALSSLKVNFFLVLASHLLIELGHFFHIIDCIPFASQNNALIKQQRSGCDLEYNCRMMRHSI
jgi:hypothetical protein